MSTFLSAIGAAIITCQGGVTGIDLAPLGAVHSVVINGPSACIVRLGVAGEGIYPGHECHDIIVRNGNMTGFGDVVISVKDCDDK